MEKNKEPVEEKKPLLIVDDDDDVRSQMKWALAEDYQVLLAEDRPEAVKIAQDVQPPVICLDLGLPPDPADVSEGFAALGELVANDPRVKVILITGQADKKNALKAVEQGAYDFFSKPIEIDSLKIVLQRAYYLRQLEEENQRLQEDVGEDSFEGMLGTSPPMQEVFAAIRKVATSDAPVLINGESGTGKELAAHAIHRLSRRKDGPFVAINCGAIPENLLESELFGHEKGAFTGAHIQRPGQIEQAQGGTLFLDEIGELTLALQVKLLRFLQEGQIQRVGGRKQIQIDARIIAATNVDLQEALKQNEFREDLYYRLAVIVICMPPLRERDEDLSLLGHYFLRRYSDEQGKTIKGFASRTMRALESYTWPGNVRELENRIRRAVIMAEGGKIKIHDLGLDPNHEVREHQSLKQAREALEKELIERALLLNDGNITRTARSLEVSRPTLYELMQKLNIER